MESLIVPYAERVRQAAAERTPLRIRGSGAKDFLGCELNGEVLDSSNLRGIVSYEPTELVITARAGTPLQEIEEALSERGQMLAFEPPYFGAQATLGGCVAAGLSGPRRAQAGAVRDFVLGVRMLNGAAEDLSFGGQVMKNVAGFDVSRLMAGSMGTLGLLLEISLKVLPRPASELSLRFPLRQAEAIETMNRWAAQPLPISATCYAQGMLSVRLSGAQPAVEAARKKLGGELLADAATFWRAVREQTLPEFRAPLWRCSVKSTASPLPLSGSQILEWNGSLRWINTEAPAQAVRRAASEAGGHATLFRGDGQHDMIELPPELLDIHRRLKAALDPQRIFGPGRLHPEL